MNILANPYLNMFQINDKLNVKCVWVSNVLFSYHEFKSVGAINKQNQRHTNNRNSYEYWMY